MMSEDEQENNDRKVGRMIVAVMACLAAIVFGFMFLSVDYLVMAVLLWSVVVAIVSCAISTHLGKPQWVADRFGQWFEWTHMVTEFYLGKPEPHATSTPAAVEAKRRERMGITIASVLAELLLCVIFAFCGLWVAAGILCLMGLATIWLAMRVHQGNIQWARHLFGRWFDWTDWFVENYFEPPAHKVTNNPTKEIGAPVLAELRKTPAPHKLTTSDRTEFGYRPDEFGLRPDEFAPKPFNPRKL